MIRFIGFVLLAIFLVPWCIVALAPPLPFAPLGLPIGLILAWLISGIPGRLFRHPDLTNPPDYWPPAARRGLVKHYGRKSAL
jgi:hypothetical protein